MFNFTTLLKEQHVTSSACNNMVVVIVAFDFKKSIVNIRFNANKQNYSYLFQLTNLNDKFESKNYRVLQGIILAIEQVLKVYKIKPLSIIITHSIRWLSNLITPINSHVFKYAQNHNVALKLEYQK